MRRWKIIVQGILIALTVATTIRYAFVQSFIPNAVRQALPQNTTSAYQAVDLDGLLETPPCMQIDHALGTMGALRELVDNNPWVDRLTPAEMAVGNVKIGQQETWVVTSWIGWRSPWLRWKIEGTKAAGLTKLKRHYVWPVWEYKGDPRTNGSTLYFSLTDNLFIACLSTDPSAIDTFLYTYDKHPFFPSNYQRKSL